MGNFHSNITERLQKIEFFEKNWFADLFTLLRGVRDEILGKIGAILQYFKLQPMPIHSRVSFHQPSGDLMTRRRSHGALNGAYQNPEHFRVYQEQIEVNNINEMKLVVFVCGVNFTILLFLLYYLFM